jgi:hypothetical protein
MKAEALLAHNVRGCVQHMRSMMTRKLFPLQRALGGMEKKKAAKFGDREEVT